MQAKITVKVDQASIRAATDGIFILEDFITQLRLGKDSPIVFRTIIIDLGIELHCVWFDIDRWVDLVMLGKVADRRYREGVAFDITVEQARPAVFHPSMLQLGHMNTIMSAKESPELLPFSWYKDLSTKLLQENVIETEDAGGNLSTLEYNLAYDALDIFCRYFMLNPCQGYDEIAIDNEINKTKVAFGLNWTEDDGLLDTTSAAKAKAKARAQVSDQVKRVIDAAAAGLAAAAKAEAARNPLVELDTTIFLKSTGHPRPPNYTLSVDSPLEIRGVVFIFILMGSSPI